MLYWYTGQPGHGKTLHAIQAVLAMKEKADKQHEQDPVKYPYRKLLVCNVREFDYAGTCSIELTPEHFKVWADSPEYVLKRDAIVAATMSKDARSEAVDELEKEDCATVEIDPYFENCIVLIDEAYEHGIFPKRPAAAKIPRHVERMAKHRHYGMDFVCVCQSPDTQCDSFLRDLIEEHVHVNRKFGTQVVIQRVFDKFTANAERATPLTTRTGKLPKKIFGLYKSTVLDTTEKRIPWYYYAFVAMLIGLPLFGWFVVRHVGGQLSGKDLDTGAQQGGVVGVDGVRSTKAAPGAPPAPKSLRETDYAAWLKPRVVGQPWTAPAYDQLTVPHDPPRVFCMSSGHMGRERWVSESCSCLTEQGTAYLMDHGQCALMSRSGQYEPFLVVSNAPIQGNTSEQQFKQLQEKPVSVGKSYAAPPPPQGYHALDPQQVKSAP